MFENQNQLLYDENESFSMESSTKPHNQIIVNESQFSGSFFFFIILLNLQKCIPNLI